MTRSAPGDCDVPRKSLVPRPGTVTLTATLALVLAVIPAFAGIASHAAAAPADSAAPVEHLRDGATGRIEFRSVTPTGPTQLVRRSYDSAGTVIVGTLTLPADAPGRLPAVVLAHGSGGLLPGREDAWAERLLALGVATFVLDSFGPRGLASTATEQSRLSTMANVADVLSALTLLATHPRLDSTRIGVMGFSRGGQAALYSALEPLRRGVVEGELRFAAHVALYPSCSIPYHAQRVSPAPMLMLLAGADDYTPPEACLAYADWFRARGAQVRTAVYAGAYHDFDIPQPPRRLPRLQSARACGAVVDVETGRMRVPGNAEGLSEPARIRDYLRGCMQRGATIGGNAEALRLAQADVAAFLADALGPLPRPPQR